MFLALSFMFFFSTKSENRRVDQVLPDWAGGAGRRGEVGKGYRRMNMVQIIYTHVYKCKNDTC
jgi:hypothetical protein